MAKRKFYDWRYNTPAAVAQRKQKVIEQTALERRRRQALKAAASQELDNSSQQLQSLKSDEFLQRLQNLNDTPRRAPPPKPAPSRLHELEAAHHEEVVESEPDQDTNTWPGFQTELEAIKKMKLSKHDKGVKINLLKQKYKSKEAADKKLRALKIEKSNKRRLNQTKTIQKKKRSGQLKLGGASTVLLQRLQKTLHANTS